MGGCFTLEKRNEIKLTATNHRIFRFCNQLRSSFRLSTSPHTSDEEEIQRIKTILNLEEEDAVETKRCQEIDTDQFSTDEVEKFKELDSELRELLAGQRSSSIMSHNDALSHLIWGLEQLYRTADSQRTPSVENEDSIKSKLQRLTWRNSHIESEEMEVAQFITKLVGHTTKFKNSKDAAISELVTNVKRWRQQMFTSSLPTPNFLIKDGHKDQMAKLQEKMVLMNKDDLYYEKQTEREVRELTENPALFERRTRRTFASGKKILRPTNVLYQYYKSLVKLHDWEFSIFDLSDETEGTPLTVAATMIFHSHYMFRNWSFDENLFLNFAKAIDKGYNDLPYHNSSHAGDVMQATHYWIYTSQKSFQQGACDIVLYEELDKLALLFSAMVHDYKHPGFTNQFLVATGHDLAITYNDQSVLENMHVAEAFKVLRKPNHNFIKVLSPNLHARFREVVIDTVFKTDMKFHQHVVYDLSKCLDGSVTGEEYRTIVRRCTVHLADISHPTRSNSVHIKWSSKITEEFYHQGDLEREQGIPHQMPIFDRHKNNMVKAQIGFIDFIVKTAFMSFVQVVPAASPSLDYLHENCKYWQNRETRRSTVNQRRRESRFLLQNSIRL